MAVINVTKENYEEIKNSGKTVLLDFYADWCGPCKMVSPIVDQISEEHPEYLVGKINVDDEDELSESFGVMSIPTLCLMKEGKVVNSHTGFAPKEVLEEFIKA